MRTLIPIAVASCCTLIGCAGPSATREAVRPDAVVPQAHNTNKTITIIAVAKFYVSGVPTGLKWGELWGETNGVERLVADGVLLEIVKPVEFQGKIYTMHDDAHIADHYFTLGSRYELQVKVEDIGRFWFGPCTAVPFRKVDKDEE